MCVVVCAYPMAYCFCASCSWMHVIHIITCILLSMIFCALLDVYAPHLHIVSMHSISVTSSPSQQSTVTQSKGPFLFALKTHVPREIVSETQKFSEREKKGEKYRQREQQCQ